MQDFGCRTDDGWAFGRRDGFCYSARLLQGGEASQILFRFVSVQDTGALAKRLNRDNPTHLRWIGDDEEDEPALEALYSPPSDFYAKAGIHNLLHNVAALYRDGALHMPESCPLCGLPSCDAAAFVNGAYRPVHAACVETRLDLPPKDTVTEVKPGGNVATGILGAVVGAVIAALPIWTLALNNGQIYWVLYAFIPFLSGLCYRLFRGRANANLAGGAVLASSLAAAFGLELVWYWLVMSAGYGQNIPFSVSTGQYFATHSLALTVQEMFTCLLAVMAGFVAISIVLRRYAEEKKVPKQVKRGSEYVKRTLLKNSEASAESTQDDQTRQATGL